jgi:hypothetical protein
MAASNENRMLWLRLARCSWVKTFFLLDTFVRFFVDMIVLFYQFQEIFYPPGHIRRDSGQGG